MSTPAQGRPATGLKLSDRHEIDLEALIDTRLLIQANSGGGKSYCIRRILEQSHGRVQHLVIDPEGEFATLRERFDYVLAARRGGDTAAEPRIAKLLAERLLQLGASAVLDIYELKAHERIQFVRYFLEALVDAPKSLWHRVLVVVDEAHVFCPQHGEAESAGAVIDLATRGRKRGFAAVLATQRLAKLHKDAAAECNNKLIGRTGQDLDVKRAADELGLGKERWRELRELEPGRFFAFGPAISREVKVVDVGPVQTTHPKAGSRIAAAPPPPRERVKALLPKLADLPAEAEERAKTLDDLRKENAGLRRELTLAKKATPPAPAAPAPPLVPGIPLAQLRRHLAPTLRKLERLAAGVEQLLEQASAAAADLELLVNDEKHGKVTDPKAAALLASVTPSGIIVGRPVSEALWNRPGKVERVPPVEPRGDLGAGERKVLTAIAQHPEGVTRETLTVLTGYKRSSRDTYLQRLRAADLIETQGDRILATDAGVQSLGPEFEPLPTGTELQEHWRRRLPEGERRILEPLLKAYPDEVSRDRLSELTGYRRSSRDTYLQRLRARQLVVTSGAGVTAAPVLFE